MIMDATYHRNTTAAMGIATNRVAPKAQSSNSSTDLKHILYNVISPKITKNSMGWTITTYSLVCSYTIC